MKSKRLKKFRKAYMKAWGLSPMDRDAMTTSQAEFYEASLNLGHDFLHLARAAEEVIKNWDTGSLTNAVSDLGHALERLK